MPNVGGGEIQPVLYCNRQAPSTCGAESALHFMVQIDFDKDGDGSAMGHAPISTFLQIIRQGPRILL